MTSTPSSPSQPAWSDPISGGPVGAPRYDQSGVRPPPVGSPPEDGRRRPRIGDLLVAGGGALITFFSFAPFVAYDDRLTNFVREFREEVAAEGEVIEFAGSFTAWSTQTFMAPITWWVIASGFLLMVLACFRLATRRGVSVAGFSATQLEIVLALYAFSVLLGYSFSDKQGSFGYEPSSYFAEFPTDLRFDWGGMLMLIGAAIAVTGAVLNHVIAPVASGGDE